MNPSQDLQFNPEQEVLLWAIRVDHTKDQRVSGLLLAGINWAYLRESAAQHGIIPLLYKRLKGEMAALVPPKELATLRMLFQQNAIRNIRMTQHLFKTLDLLAGSGIDARPFKGPVLAVQAYGDLSMRSLGDLDILVHAEDRSLACRILMDNGYVLSDPIQTSIDKKIDPVYQKDLAFSSDNNLVEIHWELVERLFAVPLDMNQIWDRSVPVLLNNRPVKTLSPEDSVIFMCFHGLKHAFDLKFLADIIHLIVNQPDIQWPDLSARAEKIGLKRIVLIGLFLAKKHGGIRCGPEFENLLTSDTRVPDLAEEIRHIFFEFQPVESSSIEPALFLKVRERFRDRIRFLFYFYRQKVLIHCATFLGRSPSDKK